MENMQISTNDSTLLIDVTAKVEKNVPDSIDAILDFLQASKHTIVLEVLREISSIDPKNIEERSNLNIPVSKPKNYGSFLRSVLEKNLGDYRTLSALIKDTAIGFASYYADKILHIEEEEDSQQLQDTWRQFMNEKL